ncbi:hypothetical protein WICMUC_000621 [Wickerhamomyces mucosus]|uniref:Protein kinase domain-containing protein n=1 Tax=Wickerhamomyces mucosus TaxID=1378264 RepID=A0A9P8THL4_9ASCO|nr:hypothetical protein WICMUC_000621 [Wickerhamomyces mucosus]
MSTVWESSNTQQSNNNDTLQYKFSKLNGLSQSKIPVKSNRQVSAPITPLDESTLGAHIKRSFIPRITSSPSVPEINQRYLRSHSIKSSPVQEQTSTPKIHKSKEIDTPPSTLTKLSREMRLLSLNTPPAPSYDSPSVRSRPLLKKASVLKERNTDDFTVADLANKNRSVSSPHLGDRAANLNSAKDLMGENRSPIRQSSQESSRSSKKNLSVPKTTRRRVVSSKTNSNDSPLVRLTRSTTASNLKIVAKSPTKVPQKQEYSSFPKKMPPRRPISDTKLKDRVTVNDYNSKLVIPKKRSFTKSYSVNTGLKDLVGNNEPTAPRGKRLPERSNASTLRSQSIFSQSSRRNSLKDPITPSKVSTSEELYNTLLSFPKTFQFISTWSFVKSSSNIANLIHKVRLPETLDSFERAEIVNQKEKIYYIGENLGVKTRNSMELSQNFGFDDDKGNLKVNMNDHISYRYQVVSKLGFGMFGNVFKCIDHKERKVISLKIMKNDINWSLQSMNEIKVLKLLNSGPNILSYIEHFNFRSHICIATELLAVNLLEALESTKFKGFELNVIQSWSRQLLSGLQFMHEKNIIHCDLKPENIMLMSPNSLNLKIIDFGSSTVDDDLTYSYIQSRFYRAPEVLLGCRYNKKIDIWSFGCLIYEMYRGVPLFEVKDELQLFKAFIKTLGFPSPRTILSYRNVIFKNGSINSRKDPNFIDKKTMIFSMFDRLGTYNNTPLGPIKKEPLSKKIGIDNVTFIQFLEKILVWDHSERHDAYALLGDDFLKLSVHEA